MGDMPAELLPDYLELEGGTVSHRARGGHVAGHLVAQGDVDLDVPPLDAHFLELTLTGRAAGRAYAEGLISTTTMTAEPGRVSFLPAGRAANLHLRGSATHLQLLIRPEAMEAAKRELMRGDPDRIELFAFNTFTDIALERRLRRAHNAVLGGGHLAIDMVAHEICAELVLQYSDGKPRVPSCEPSFSKLQSLRAIDLIEACVPLDAGLPELAEAMEMPLRDFVHAFETEMGMDPATYLAERRLDHAIEAIQRSRLDCLPEPKPAELARNCGFGTPRRLDAAFRERFGTDMEGYISEL